MSLERYHDWIVASALPLWAERGFDPAAGRFHERLDRAARPIDVPHRAMVQARQIAVFAHAAELGWSAAGGALAEAAMASLLRDYCIETADEASFAFSIRNDGTIVSDVRDAYAHAFVLFSIAALYRLDGDARLLEIADKTIRFIDRALADRAHGGLFDAAPIDARDKRQNPHMHLLEAYLFLAAAAPGRGYDARAADLVALFRTRLFRREPGVLIEYFAEDWSPHADPARAALWEPGHHFEWVWLLARYRALTGEDVADLALRLHAIACEHGIAPDGLIYDALDTGLRVVAPSHRVWPHCEAIKAALARDEPALAQTMAGALLETFLDTPFAGGWTDHIAPDRTPLVDYVPASTLYHLFLPAAEAAASHQAR